MAQEKERCLSVSCIFVQGTLCTRSHPPYEQAFSFSGGRRQARVTSMYLTCDGRTLQPIVCPHPQQYAAFCQAMISSGVVWCLAESISSPRISQSLAPPAPCSSDTAVGLDGCTKRERRVCPWLWWLCYIAVTWDLSCAHGWNDRSSDFYTRPIVSMFGISSAYIRLYLPLPSPSLCPWAHAWPFTCTLPPTLACCVFASAVSRIWTVSTSSVNKLDMLLALHA